MAHYDDDDDDDVHVHVHDGFCPIHFSSTATFAGTSLSLNIVISRIVTSGFHCIGVIQKGDGDDSADSITRVLKLKAELESNQSTDVKLTKESMEATDLVSLAFIFSRHSKARYLLNAIRVIAKFVVSRCVFANFEWVFLFRQSFEWGWS